MNQSELKEFFSWCEENIKTFNKEDCDESEHYYIKDTLIGGWAGDTRSFFYEHSNIFAKALRMMDADKNFDKEVENGMDY